MGWLVLDRDGDAVVDALAARVLLPQAATEAHAATAANVAARLGFETAGLEPGLADIFAPDATYAAPVVLVGVDAVPGAAAARAGLAPGQGAVALLPPDDALGAGGLLLVGHDATGLLAVGEYVAARHPAVWAPDGTAWDAVGRKVDAFLAGRSISADSARLQRVVVEAGRAGPVSATLVVRLGDRTALRGAAAALAGRDTTAADSAAADSAAADPVAAPDTAAADTAAAASPADSGAARPRPRGPLALSELEFTDLHRLDIRLEAPDSTALVRVLPRRPWRARAAPEGNAGSVSPFTLSRLYSTDGLLRDTNGDGLPDRMDAVFFVSGGEAAPQLADLAARLGLESTGIRLPLARAAGTEDRPEAAGVPIAFGIDGYQAQRLREKGRLHMPAPGAGQGFLELVPRAFGGGTGLVIGAADARGLEAVTGVVASRMPYLWTYGKGEYELADVETEVRRFFQAVEAPGQVALGVFKLRQWLARLGDAPVEALAVELAAEEAPAGLEAHLSALLAAHYPEAETEVTTFTTGFGVGQEIFTQELAIPWEVDTARALLSSQVYPAVRAGQGGRVELRVSEPPELRARLVAEIRDSLRARGADPAAWDVDVLSAYKQGYSWLVDDVLPELRELPVDSMAITYHTLEESEEVRWQTIAADTRWLQELYPVDAVLARELAISDSVITFTPTRAPDPIYRVRAFDAAGRELLERTFTPRYVVRPFFDLFPEYEQIRVTTGWLTAESGGQTLVDRRIRTDPEAFWDLLQTDIYGRIVDYVVDVQDGRPSGRNAPYFDEFRVDLTLSEPNYRIGVDEEVISSLEALHEDIYFETLTLFDLIGNRYGVGGLSYPGRILPWIHEGTGAPGTARIAFTGKERAAPELVLRATVAGQEPTVRRYGLSSPGTETPQLRGLSARAGEAGIGSLLFEVEAVDSLDRYEEYRLRSSEAGVDRTFLSVEMLAGMVEALGALHADGVLEQRLSFDRVGELRFRFILEDTASDFTRTSVLPRSRNPLSTAARRLYAGDWRHTGERLVQWETPIPPAESDSILARLATFPGVRVYQVAESFLGQPVWAADFHAAEMPTYVSELKLTAQKPTLFLSGRQHANEVSSTSHLLRLGELLATDSAYRALLRDVNVVLHPITNPDGARLAYEMQLDNPDFMLHAGYLGALGVDATSGSGGSDPLYPESHARPRISGTWLPDIYINMHGYPSHEWVQYFAGYSAWVRSRAGGQRDWWLPRGWFIPGFSWVDDERYPEIKEAQYAVLDSIAAAITGDPEIEAMNQRMYVRYRKYGEQDREGFRENFRNGLLVYESLRGRRVSGSGASSPRVTWFSVTTEAPDETARGDWLELVARAGLAHSSALLRYLAAGEVEVDREAAAVPGGVVRTVGRERPVLPPEPPDNGGS
ncbi:MAG: M14 family metallopeptidase [Gemmatimonadota bacterium]